MEHKTRLIGLFDYFSIFFIILSFILAAVFYGSMPEKMATHWNFSGNADGYSGKNAGLFMFPILLIVIFCLLKFFPLTDPLKENIMKFWNVYSIFLFLFTLFMFYLFSLVLVWNSGIKFNMTFFIIPAFSGLFIGIGKLLGRTKRNYMIGIRTPWTIHDDKVWEKTHRLGEKIFIFIGIILIPAVFFLKIWALFLLILPPIYLIFYSYIEYKKIIRKS
jgi:uncharacterized membrane protein